MIHKKIDEIIEKNNGKIDVRSLIDKLKKELQNASEEISIKVQGENKLSGATGAAGTVEEFDPILCKRAIMDLKRGGRVIEFDKKLWHVPSLDIEQGYVHTNGAFGVWIEKEKTFNEYGVCQAVPEMKNVVFNKSSVMPGALSSYVKLGKGNKEYAYSLEWNIDEPITVCAAWNGECWCVLNNELGASLPEQLKLDVIKLNIKKNDVCSFKINSSLEVKELENLGNLRDPGIEAAVAKRIFSLEKIENKCNSLAEQQSNVHLDSVHFEEGKDLKKSKVAQKYKDLSFFTIDSASTKDIDDAIAVVQDESGYDLYVAIADVDYFVKKDSELDLNAQDMSNTFYMLTSKKINMFPKSLSQDVCSLNNGEAKQVMIFNGRYDLDGKLIKSQFEQAQIVPKVKISYNDVDAFFEGAPLKESVYWDEQLGETKVLDRATIEGKENIKSSLNLFKELSSKIKKILPRGYYPATIYPVLGGNGKVDHLEKDERDGLLSQQIVETFMLAANVGAAQFLNSKYPHVGIFRNQQKPVESERQQPAEYNRVNEGHHGLQEEMYTHFTSPIRRYCDLLVHRLIKSVINGEPTPYTNEQIEEIARKSNYNSYISKQVHNKEFELLYKQYLETLVKDKTLKNKFKANDFNENGVSLINEQLIDTFVPYFKLNEEIKAFCTHPDIGRFDKKEVINKLNETWKFKVYIDRYDCLDERVNSHTQIYRRDLKADLNAGVPVGSSGEKAVGNKSNANIVKSEKESTGATSTAGATGVGEAALSDKKLNMETGDCEKMSVNVTDGTTRNAMKP